MAIFWGPMDAHGMGSGDGITNRGLVEIVVLATVLGWKLGEPFFTHA